MLQHLVTLNNYGGGGIVLTLLASTMGISQQLRRWWDSINTVGKHYGYFPNAVKSVLLVKEEFYEKAFSCFDGSDVSVQTDGVRLLGSPIVSESFVDGYIKDTIDTWLHDLDFLCTFAESQPQAAYAAFTHGRWTHSFRSCSVPSEHLSVLDEMIQCKLIPAVSETCY